VFARIAIRIERCNASHVFWMLKYLFRVISDCLRCPRLTYSLPLYADIGQVPWNWSMRLNLGVGSNQIGAGHGRSQANCYASSLQGPKHGAIIVPTLREGWSAQPTCSCLCKVVSRKGDEALKAISASAFLWQTVGEYFMSEERDIDEALGFDWIEASWNQYTK